MFGRLVGWYTCIYFWALLSPNGILPVAKFTLRPSVAFSCIGSVTAQYSSSDRQPNFAAWYKERNYGTFAHPHFEQTALHIYSSFIHHKGRSNNETNKQQAEKKRKT